MDTPDSGREGAGGSPPTDEPAPSTPPQQPAPDWRDKRIATLTRRLRELQEQQQQPPGQTPPPQQPGQQPPYQPPGLTQADIDRLAEQKAQGLAAMHEFNRRCDEVAISGRQTFGESRFNERIGQLQKLVDVNDRQSIDTYNMFLTAAMDTGDAAKILYALGADLDEAQRIMGMPPTRMAAELTRRALQAPGGPNGNEISGAPRPMTTVGSTRGSLEGISPDDPDRSDHLGTAEWMRRREAQVADRIRVRNAR